MRKGIQILAILLAAPAAMAVTPDIRFEPYVYTGPSPSTRGAGRYRLLITSPWDPNNKVYLMSPEHLQYTGGNGIIRYSDSGVLGVSGDDSWKPLTYAWQVDAGGKRATYDVTKWNDANMRVQAEIIVDPNNPWRLILKMTFTNTGSSSYGNIYALIDVRYNELQSPENFPAWGNEIDPQQRFLHHYVMRGGSAVTGLGGTATTVESLTLPISPLADSIASTSYIAPPTDETTVTLVTGGYPAGDLNYYWMYDSGSNAYPGIFNATSSTFVHRGDLTGVTGAVSFLPRPQIRETLVRDSPFPSSGFAVNNRGNIAESADTGFQVLENKDANKFLSIHSGRNARSCLANSSIPCIHADALYDDFTPGSTYVQYHEILFHEGALSGTLPTAPTSGFSTTSIVGQTVSLDGSASTGGNTRPILTYDWDFGDGSPAGTGPTPNHTYGSAGTYGVTLTVTDILGYTDAITTPVTLGGPDSLPPSVAATSVDVSGVVTDVSIQDITVNGSTTVMLGVGGTFTVSVPITGGSGSVTIMATDAAALSQTRTVNVSAP